MIQFIVRIDQRGRIILPSLLREELGIEQGDFVMLSINGTKVTMTLSSEQGRCISRNVMEI